MIEAPIPRDEEARLKTLRGMEILDTPPEDRFDRITRIATRLFDVPISTLTLIDSDREWFLSMQGLAERQGPRARSFCGHALLQDDVMVVTDALNDPRFDGNPMVVGPPHIRFYAGRTLYAADGKRIGVFCVKDTKPRQMTDEEVSMLRDLAQWAELEINARDFRKAVNGLEIFKREERTRRELEALLNILPMGIMVFGTDGRVDLFNPAMATMSGIRAEQAMGADVFSLFNERNAWLAKLLRQGMKNEPSISEIESIAPEGKQGLFHCTVVPITDGPGGIPKQVMAIFEDHLRIHE